MNYDRDGETLTYARPAGAYTFAFRAADIAKERTGVHAKLFISINGADLAWGYINCDKDEDRVRIINSAYSMIATDQRKNGLAEYPKEYLKADVNEFCKGLWDATVEAMLPEDMPGALNPEPPAFIVKPWALDGGGTIMFAPPGRGKSYVMLLLAACVYHGIDLFWPVRRTDVLIINLERSRQSLMQRLGNVNRCLGLPRDTPIPTLNAKGRTFHDMLPGARRHVQDRTTGLVFLDSISRAGMGDLTENNPVNKIVDGLNGLGPAWFGLGHTPRGDTSHVYGSQMFDAAADLTVRLHSQQDEDGPLGIGLELDKRNDIGRFPMSILALDFDELGLTSVRKARPGEFPEVEAGKRKTIRQQLRDFVLDSEEGLADATTAASELKLRREEVSRIFNSDPWFVFVRKDGRNAKFGLVDDG